MESRTRYVLKHDHGYYYGDTPGFQAKSLFNAKRFYDIETYEMWLRVSPFAPLDNIDEYTLIPVTQTISEGENNE